MGPGDGGTIEKRHCRKDHALRAIRDYYLLKYGHLLGVPGAPVCAEVAGAGAPPSGDREMATHES